MSTRTYSALAPILSLVALSAGCIPFSTSEDRDEDSRSGFHDVTVSWRLRNLDGTTMATCPAGFTTMVTHMYRVGLVEPPDALIIMPCTPEGSFTQPTATAGELLDEAGGYGGYFDYTPVKDIWIDVTEETFTSFAAKTFYYSVELTSDITIHKDLYPDGGVAVAAWTLVSSLTSAPLASCASAGVDQIQAAYRPYQDENAPLVVIGTWPCDAVDPYYVYDPNANSTLLDEPYELGSGHTSPLAPGEYFIELRGLRGGTVVGTSMSSVRMEGGNASITIQDPDIVISDR